MIRGEDQDRRVRDMDVGVQLLGAVIGGPAPDQSRFRLVVHQMRSLPLFHSFVLSFSPLSAIALSIPFYVHLPRQSSNTSVISVGNTQNAFYYSNITLGGRQISVMLDTGRYGPLFPTRVTPLTRRQL